MKLSRLLCCISLIVFADISGRAGERAAEIYRAASASVFMISIHGVDNSPVSFGTGFLIGAGKLATNWHVVKGGKPFLELGTISVPLEVEAKDEAADLAILSVKANISAQSLKLASDIPMPGDEVFAIGNPEGLENSITTECSRVYGK